MKTLRRGFTLIELLIVVAIIGILAVALVPTISDAPARARDATRKALVNSVITAIESYNIDNGGYPIVAADTVCLDVAAPVGEADITSLIANNLNGNLPTTPNAVSNPPADETCTNAVFYSSDGGTSYSVGILLEIANGTAKDGVEDQNDQENNRYFVIDRG